MQRLLHEKILKKEGKETSLQVTTQDKTDLSKSLKYSCSFSEKLVFLPIINGYPIPPTPPRAPTKTLFSIHK